MKSACGTPQHHIVVLVEAWTVHVGHHSTISWCLWRHEECMCIVHSLLSYLVMHGYHNHLHTTYSLVLLLDPAPKRKSSLILELTFFYYSIFVKLSFCKQLSKVLLQISMASLIWWVFYLQRPFYGLQFSILRYGKWQPQMRSNIVWTNIDELTYQARCILLLNSCRTFLSFILYFWNFFEKTSASPPFRNRSRSAPISRFNFNAVDQKNFTQYS